MKFDTEALLVVAAIGVVGFVLYRKVSKVIDQAQPIIAAAAGVAQEVGDAQAVWNDIKRVL